MQVELNCQECYCRFVAPPDAASEDIIERMTNEGTWYALGDGVTFEDMIFTALTGRGAIHCPECSHPVAVGEESLGQLAMEVLAQW